ncbi:MAG: hypothetical protein AAGD11_10435 [Planctomycetota bacterium]
MSSHQLFVALSLCLSVSLEAVAVDREWQGQSPPSWGFALNWTPIGLPQLGEEILIGDFQHQDVGSELNADYTIGDLTLAYAANVDTNGHTLTVDGELSMRGDQAATTSQVFVREHNSGPAVNALEVEELTLLVDSEFILDGGRMVVAAPGTDHGDISVVTTSSTFGGYGVLRFQDALTTTVDQLSNLGTLQTSRPQGAPASQRFTLRIESTDPTDSRINLDATGVHRSVVNLASMTTLDIDTQFRSNGVSNFHGTMNLAAGSIFDTSDSTVANNKFVIDSVGEVNVNAFSASAGVPNTATFRGPMLELEAEADLNINSGTFILENGLTTAATSTIDIGPNAGLQIDEPSSIDGDINFNSTGTSLVVNDSLTIDDMTFDWDGSEDGVTTVNTGGSLMITADNIESGAGNSRFDGTINLNEGSLQTFVPSGWTMAGDWNFTNGGDYFFSTGTVTITGNVHVSSGRAQIAGEAVFASGSTTTIQGTNDNLSVNGEKTIEAGAQFTGNGVLQNTTNGDLTLADGANVQVPFLNDGAPSGTLPDLFIADGIGQARLLTFDQTSRGQVFFELASATQYDQLNVDLTAIIDGIFNVELLGNFNPQVGDEFTILSTGAGVFGQFDNGVATLPALLSGRKWFIDYGNDDVTLRVLYSADVDNDGDVDGDDFLIIQRQIPSRIPEWQSQYGMSVASLATVQVVPEPQSWILLLSALVLFTRRLRS